MLEAPSSDLPWMVAADVDEEIEFTVDMKTADKFKDGGPDEKWSCYRADFEVDGEEFEQEEVPFWAMKAFFDVFGKKKGKASGTYTRTETKKKGKTVNEATFELA